MRIAIATDAWHPQINGVVRTLEMTVQQLRARGHEVCMISPEQFRTVPCPGYGEIRLAVAPRFGLRKKLTDVREDADVIESVYGVGYRLLESANDSTAG